MPLKVELVNTAVGLGLVAADTASNLTKAELESLISKADLEELTPEGSKGIEGKGKEGEEGDPYAGDGEITPTLGHIVLVVGSNSEFGEEGELLEVGGVSEHGIQATDSDGNTITIPWSALGQDVTNTGLAPWDVVQLSDGMMGVVQGVSKKSSTVAVIPYEHHGLAGVNFRVSTGEPEPVMVVNERGNTLASKTIGVLPDDIVRQWSMGEEAKYELTQDGADYMSKIASLCKLEGFPIPNPNDALSVYSTAKLVHDSRPSPKGANTVLLKNLDMDEGRNLDVEYHPSDTHTDLALSAQQNGSSVEFIHVPFGVRDFVDALNAEGVLAAAFNGSGDAFSILSLHHLEARQPRQQDQPQQQQSQSSKSTKEGIMEQSRKSLADMKGTPDNPKKESTSQKKIKSLVEETVANTTSLEEAVAKVIERKRDDLRDLLGVNADMKKLGDQVLDDIETAFREHASTLDSWKHSVEQKITSKVVYDIPEMPEVSITDPHMTFDDLLFNCVNRLPTLLVGPSGSFKTTAARQAADVLNLPFGYIPLGPTQTEAKFAGYPDAQGNFVPTEFYLKYKYGGVILLDEIDAGNPSVLVWINGAIQNKQAAFPRGFMTRLEGEGFSSEADALVEAGGMVDMHPDCVVIASANTFGRGADLVYQGRNALDGATLKRFKVLMWDYDEALERKLAGDDLWVSFVQSVRAVVYELQMHHIVSPVDSIDGARMIAAGQDWQKVSLQTVFAGLKKEQIKKIFNGNDTLKDLRSELANRQSAGKGAAV